ncbi:hypothetical protein [Streptomyces sp. CBMA152]|uniref:hypothetical protein n=1 Tax=Streptomyces sp. CBMA152 TaxID=1896312 RepID=UPI00166085E0|nr:hypothetical protein [Streptomyces sp. CBMA152]MBD0741940.1 hypothetical protein [Streptomyces sp. CBMA152]
MTQSNPQPSEGPAGPGEAAADTTGKAAPRRGRLVRLTRQGRTRWVVLGVVVLLAAGGAAAVAEHHHHEGDRGGYAAEGRGHHGERGADGRAGQKMRGDERPGGAGGQGWGRMGHGPAGGGFGQAPAPLPALPAAQAVDKAAAAVSGGKVEALRVVAQQGGGSAWQAVVLGPDGVRHAVTLSGADGTVTSNTVVGGAPAAKG